MDTHKLSTNVQSPIIIIIILPRTTHLDVDDGADDLEHAAVLDGAIRHLRHPALGYFAYGV